MSGFDSSFCHGDAAAFTLDSFCLALMHGEFAGRALTRRSGARKMPFEHAVTAKDFDAPKTSRAPVTNYFPALPTAAPGCSPVNEGRYSTVDHVGLFRHASVIFVALRERKFRACATARV
jgi:hypothetical protein